MVEACKNGDDAGDVNNTGGYDGGGVSNNIEDTSMPPPPITKDLDNKYDNITLNT